jgi:rhodanese-related sulfurtransferase
VSTPLPHALATAALLLSLCGCGSGGSGADAVSAEQILGARGAAGAPLLLDVRTPEEFARGHLAGAINIPHDQLDGRTGELDPEREIVVYCESGRRAEKASAVLAAAGFADVKLLDGHMQAWRKAGLPTE